MYLIRNICKNSIYKIYSKKLCIQLYKIYKKIYMPTSIIYKAELNDLVCFIFMKDTFNKGIGFRQRFALDNITHENRMCIFFLLNWDYVK